MSDPAPEIREAATVVLLRAALDPSDPPCIYMLRRNARSTFMPDALVFPGGRVDPEDGQGEARFAQAARRECLEEAALDLSDKELVWFDTWLTPSGESPRRYVARFFAAELAHDEGAHAQADGVETEAGRWESAVDHLAAWERGEVDLPPPTLSLLLQFARLDWAQWLAAARPQLETPILPKVLALGSKVTILLPHDPEYASSPGESEACPSRALNYPARYVRADGRWRDAAELSEPSLIET